MIMIVISLTLVKFYAFAILYVLIVMQIKLVVVVCCCHTRNGVDAKTNYMGRIAEILYILFFFIRQPPN